MKITTDTEAWSKFPFHRNWFNKLWVAEKFKYCCGPNAVSVPVKGTYIIRPIYNLHGMGAGAQFVELDIGDIDTVPPGYFWCEKFYGDHLSVDLKWESGKWKTVSMFQGIYSNSTELFRFAKWVKVNKDIFIDPVLNELWDCEYINVELVDGKVIEVHLRGSPDPVNYSEFVPVWNDTPDDVIQRLTLDHLFISSYDYVHGTNIKRLGFYVKCL